jgi:hypothetical protein
MMSVVGVGTVVGGAVAGGALVAGVVAGGEVVVGAGGLPEVVIVSGDSDAAAETVDVGDCDGTTVRRIARCALERTGRHVVRVEAATPETATPASTTTMTTVDFAISLYGRLVRPARPPGQSSGR